MSTWGTVSYDIAASASGLPGDPLLWIFTASSVALAVLFLWLGRPERSALLAAVALLAAAYAATAAFRGPSDSPGRLPVITLSDTGGAITVTRPVVAVVNATGMAVEVTRVLPNFGKQIVLARPRRKPDCLRMRILPDDGTCFVAFKKADGGR